MSDWRPTLDEQIEQHLITQQVGKELRDAVAENRRLWRALNIYRHCRHGCVDCFCTAEARQALLGLIR